MDPALKILILEDANFDAVLIEYELEKLKSPLDVRRLVTKDEFLKGLEEFRPDLILADYRLPASDGLTALALAKEMCPEAPFIFVSGTMSPELAEEGMKQGAAYWIPQNRLSELSLTLKCALGHLDTLSLPIQESLGHEENLWPSLIHRTKKVIIVLDLDHTILEFNRGAELLTVWQRQEVQGQDFVELFVDRDKRDWARTKFARVAAGEIGQAFELAIRCRSTAAHQWFCQLSLLENLQDQAEVILLLADDFTNRLKKPVDQSRRKGLDLWR